MKTICITGYRRPGLFRRMLASLCANNLQGWRIEIQVEPSKYAVLFAAVARAHLAGLDYRLTINPQRLGVRYNPHNMLTRVFGQGAELVLYLEEDLLLSADTLDLVNWFAGLTNNPYLCLSLIAGGCASYGMVSYPGHEDILFKSKTFNALGFAVTQQNWRAHFNQAWMFDDPAIIDFNGQHQPGWDWSLFHYLIRHENLYGLAPATARATHTGRENGEYCQTEFHDLTFAGLPVTQNTPPSYRILNYDKLPANLRRHVLMWGQLINVLRLLSQTRTAP